MSDYTYSYDNGGTQEQGSAGVVAPLLDFGLINDEDPFIPSAQGWTEDVSTGNSAKVSSGLWVAGGSINDEQVIHADQATLDLNNETDVFVEVRNITFNAGAEEIAIAISADYTPGTWSVPPVNGGTLTGFRCSLKDGNYDIDEMNNGTKTDEAAAAEASITDGATVQLRLTTNGVNVQVRLYVNDVLISDTTETSPPATNFRTVAVGIQNRSGAAGPSLAVIDGGVWSGA